MLQTLTSVQLFSYPLLAFYKYSAMANAVPVWRKSPTESSTMPQRCTHVHIVQCLRGWIVVHQEAVWTFLHMMDMTH